MPVTQKLVDELLANALQNGYDLRTWTPEAIAVDLGTYSSDLEGMEEEELLPFVKDWLARHPVK